MVCANTVGIVAALDPSACFANIFNSQAAVPGPVPSPRVVVALNAIAQGDIGAERDLSCPRWPSSRRTGACRTAICAQHLPGRRQGHGAP